ncbi:putative helicase mov-10-B.2 [Drosophila nasuta]|uniref:putative helicase mov-10-B.2 n=1 Tax=Drosophila nasuta TaxID=42062 RepID=UPI00295F09C9|nr:putative helicase mov-10-B.2 [Drosophila nasuta]
MMDFQILDSGGIKPVCKWMPNHVQINECEVHELELSEANSSIDDGGETQEQKFAKLMRSLPHYVPNPLLLQAVELNFSNDSLSTVDETFGAYLKSRRLDYDNVCSVLSTLLSIEDMSTMQKYAQLMQTDVMVTKVGALCYSFMLNDTRLSPEDVLAPSVDEVVLIPMQSLLDDPLPENPVQAQLPHKREHLPLKHPFRRHVACVEKVTCQSLTFKFKDKKAFPGDEAMTERFCVIFRSRRIPFRFMHRAIQLLEKSPGVRRYLFPTQKPQEVPYGCSNLPNLSLFNSNIAYNMEQLQAVKQIVNGPNALAPHIVFGPPGTGKTTTIVEAILQLRLHQPRSRILVTAGSNSACNTVALKLCEYFAHNKHLKELLKERAKDSRFINQDVDSHRQLIRVFSRSIWANGLGSVKPLLLRHSNCSKRVYEHFGANLLREYGIIVATLCTVGRLVTDNVGKFNYFTHIFIDEAGASTEPETLIGIMGVKQEETCHVILSGDHKQLGAVITNNRAAALGLGHSLMERLMRTELYGMDANGNYDRTLQTRLRRNYRSHPEIVGLYNRLYYNGELIPQAPPDQVNLGVNWPMLRNPHFPIIFQATHGVTQKEMNSTSSFNELEAQVLVWYVKLLLNYGLGNNIRVEEQDIGVVAPYNAQGKVIKELLHNQGYMHVEVGSVENYQGREKNIIIATLVRSFASIGFMRDPRRLNVLLSRAKSLMILIGNPVTLRYHPDISYIINECKLQGNYLFKERDHTQRKKHYHNIEEELPTDHPDLCYDQMPQHISVYSSQNQNQQSILDEISSNSSSNCLCGKKSDSSQLNINMETLLQLHEDLMPFVCRCGSITLFNKQELMQLQVHLETMLTNLQGPIYSNLI